MTQEIVVQIHGAQPIYLKLYEGIIEFVESRSRNAWVGTDVADLYLRKSKRLLYGNFTKCLDLGSINADKKRGVWVYPWLMKTFPDICITYNFGMFYIENVADEALVRFMTRHGGISDGSDFAPSFKFPAGK